MRRAGGTVSFDIIFLLVTVAAVVGAIAATVIARSRGARIAALASRLNVPPAGDLELAVSDVLEHGRSADALARSTADALARLASLVPSGMLQIDERRVVTFANVAAHRLLGRPDGLLVGKTVMEAFADHNLEAIIVAAMSSGWAEAELTLRESRLPTVALHAVRSPVGGAWVVLDDLSELRRLRRIREEFLDNLSHELRTPVTNIRLLAETIARDLGEVDVSARIREGIERIDVETGHLAQMITEVLDLARMEEGSRRLALAEVDVAELVGRAIERLSVFAAHRGVGIETALPDTLPVVRGDEERLEQLLVNLLHNAVKFSPPGGSVTVRGEESGGNLDISVEDHGIGIAPDEQERIFDRFYKVDRARVRNVGGTGLGLTIARQIAESHAGRIWVESEPDMGATFRFAIPVAGPPGPATSQAKDRKSVV